MNSIFFPDRFWWLRGAQGAISAVISLCVLALLIGDLRGGENVSTETCILLLIFCVLCGALSLVSTLQALEARQWFRSRLRAIQGDQEVIPLAAINVAPNHPPELASGTLTLLRQTKPSWRQAWTGVSLFLYLFLASIAGVGIFVAYLLKIKDAFHQLPVEISVVILLGVGIMIVGPLIGLIILRHLPLKGNTMYGIAANAEGFFYYPQLGKTHFLRWEEILLFEVVGLRNPYYRRYRLYGSNAIADWRDPAPYWGAPDITREEVQERNQAILNLIVARTHLLPRTFDKRLAVNNE